MMLQDKNSAKQEMDKGEICSNLSPGYLRGNLCK